MFSNWNTFEIEFNKGLFHDVNLKTRLFELNKSKKVSSKKRFLSDLANKLLILLKKLFCDESAQTDIKNILPLNSIPSKFSELDIPLSKSSFPPQ